MVSLINYFTFYMIFDLGRDLKTLIPETNRYFRVKLESILNDIIVKQVFGRVIGQVWVIEYQKRVSLFKTSKLSCSFLLRDVPTLIFVCFYIPMTNYITIPTELTKPCGLKFQLITTMKKVTNFSKNIEQTTTTELIDGELLNTTNKIHK